MTPPEEERLLGEIKKALADGKTSFEFIDDQGKKMIINISKVNEKGICSPYDHW